ncbi:MAG: hypothetical protein HZB57_02590 [Gammaproteobacteria bacterium]|nr:hypothetical protein [Gammaproteobacteria bacterium]
MQPVDLTVGAPQPQLDTLPFQDAERMRIGVLGGGPEAAAVAVDLDSAYVVRVNESAFPEFFF